MNSAHTRSLYIICIPLEKVNISTIIVTFLVRFLMHWVHWFLKTNFPFSVLTFHWSGGVDVVNHTQTLLMIFTQYSSTYKASLFDRFFNHKKYQLVFIGQNVCCSWFRKTVVRQDTGIFFIFNPIALLVI